MAAVELVSCELLTDVREHGYKTAAALPSLYKSPICGILLRDSYR